MVERTKPAGDRPRQTPVAEDGDSDVHTGRVRADKDKTMRRPVEQPQDREQARADHAEALAKDPNAQPPQIGMSSSELNSGSPREKKIASNQAEDLPHNNM